MAKDTDQYFSVTEVISPYIDTTWFRPEHAERGKQVHKICHLYLTSKWVPALPKLTEGYIHSYIDWFSQYSPNAVYAEEEIMDKDLRVFGHPDFIGTINGLSGTGILDWKTSKSAYDHWAIQLAGYKILAERNLGVSISWVATLRLRKNGNTALFNDWTPDVNKATDLFLKAVDLYKYFYQKKYNNSNAKHTTPPQQ